ncbi:hypothetical protein HZB07_06115 [Candidatus Saganbacteria bacterium]|nr:hypothetical protein [Candidatus Saganbacteria bacterium]
MSTTYDPQVHHLHVIRDGETPESLAHSHQADLTTIMMDNKDCKFQLGDMVTIQIRRVAYS